LCSTCRNDEFVLYINFAIWRSIFLLSIFVVFLIKESNLEFAISEEVESDDDIEDETEDCAIFSTGSVTLIRLFCEPVMELKYAF